MRKQSILVLFCLMGLSLQAQKFDRVSGYLGKRFVIGAGFDFSLSNEPQKQGDGLGESQFPITLNKAYSVQAEYVLGSFFSLGAMGGISSTSMEMGTRRYDGGVHWTDANGEHDLRSVSGTPGISEQFFGLYAKWFLKGKGGLAPIGVYFSCGAMMHRYSFDFSNVRFHTYSEIGFGDHANYTYMFQKPKGTAQYPSVFISMGKAIPFGDRILADFAIKTGYLHSDDSWLESSSTYSGETTLHEYVGEDLRERVRRVYYLSYSVKLSLLL